jgi:hypothetical protein
MLPLIKKSFQNPNDMFPYIIKAVLPPMKILFLPPIKILFPCHLKHAMKENALLFVCLKEIKT